MIESVTEALREKEAEGMFDTGTTGFMLEHAI